MTKPRPATRTRGNARPNRLVGGDSPAARQVAKRMAGRNGAVRDAPRPPVRSSPRRSFRHPDRAGRGRRRLWGWLPRVRWPRLPYASLPIVVVLVVAVFVAAGAGSYVGYQLHRARAAEGARTEVRAVAGRYATEILSYDYRHLDADFAAAKKRLTDGFTKEYVNTTEKVVREKAEKYQAVVKAEPVAVSVVSAKPDTVRTLLFVNQTTTSSQLDGPKVDFNRVLMTLREVDGRWLVSNIDAL